MEGSVNWQTYFTLVLWNTDQSDMCISYTKTQYLEDSAKQNMELFLLISSLPFHTTTIFCCYFYG